MKPANKALGTLLIVDDNEMNRDLLSRRLERYGYTVVCATGGQEALDLIDRQRFDLALLDIMMPDVSGLDALASIRKHFSIADLPVIMVTAKNHSEDVVECLKLGANDYVTKPVDFPVLLARVQTHLQLKRLSELKDEFMRIASHDLKNPLTEVMGIGSVLEMMVPPGTVMNDEMFSLLSNIKRSAKKIQLIIEDFLDFQALEDGALKLDDEPLSLNDLAQEVVSGSTIYAKNKQVDVSLELSDDLALVCGDRWRLVQVVQNFLDNAIKFGPKGATVVVRTRGDDERVTLEVSDNGPGLKDEDFEKIFVKYAKLSNQPTGGEKSTGLGLAICKQLVERQGGEIGVKNNVDAGVTFWFEMPAMKEPVASRQAP